MKQLLQVVMLPTNEASRIQLSQEGKLYLIDKEGFYGTSKPQNLYLLSNEESKEGDWVYFDGYSYNHLTYPEYKGIYQIESGQGFSVEPKTHPIIRIKRENQIDKVLKINYNISFENCKKIIATTDKSLGNICECDKILIQDSKECIGGAWMDYSKCPNREKCKNSKQLPQIPESFIPVYIKAYNEGKPITEVLVEYELQTYVDNGSKYHYSDGRIQPKLRSDNTVIISSARTYTYQEVIGLLKARITVDEFERTQNR